MNTIEDLIRNDEININVWFQRINDDKQNLKKFSLNFRFYEELLAIKSIKDNDFDRARNHYYLCGLIDEFRIKRYNDRIFDYGIPYISYPVLSDNEDLIQRYAQLRYTTDVLIRGGEKNLTMEEMVLKGQTAIWCNTIQYFMIGDIEGINTNLDIIEKKALKIAPSLKIDYEFYKALLYIDKPKCEELLEQLVSPKIHKKRNINDVLAQYVSQPALGYAKLAWRLGIEVEIDNPLIPKELLPVRPLNHYEIPYNFLIEYMESIK